MGLPDRLTPGHPARRGGRWAGALTGMTAAVIVAAVGLGVPAGSAAPADAGVVVRVSASLVDITSVIPGLDSPHRRALGTGMVLTPDGEVLTCNHVIEGATSITATDVGNDRTYHAVLVGWDQADDLAVLRLQGASGLATVTPGNSSAVMPGQPVIALGNAGGLGAPSAATGRVTALGQAITEINEGLLTTQRLTGLIRSDARIAAGDSGGPLLSASGRVIGIDTASTWSGAQSFAIPIDEAEAIVSQVKARRASAQVRLGCRPQELC